ncbi:MAG: GtrA family protein [Paramuribaculum sp.]|nr:GtrA family protein [Candidatus Amulumruptor sp.]MDE6588607.1 GtrA family protein [Paramuribaculum sp.]MDE7152468.1 GtrA family protein [Candidatus Amulumruptor sp.]
MNNETTARTRQHHHAMKRTNILQFVRYAMVGALNTILTLVVIYACKDFFGINIWVSNAIGYIAGFINSFLWNKLWVFRSSAGYLREAIKFVGGFLLCYCLQFAATWLLNGHSLLAGREWSLFGFVISGYGIATLMGMVIYTLANFFYNKAITFATDTPVNDFE